MQKNWIEEAKVPMLSFHSNKDEAITVFTTRPDTICGVLILSCSRAYTRRKKLQQQSKKILLRNIEKPQHLKAIWNERS
jgi:leucyl-tRNA synthetase